MEKRKSFRLADTFSRGDLDAKNFKYNNKNSQIKVVKIVFKKESN
ncbi:hypothetical protein [Borreliella lusitaniae]|nr:hypothetical protein [Borreliella lusitaniae]WNY67305.1 hypothetical protein QIA40_04805 [Borreliella lusitaniae]